ncbi:MAG: hypothetical protein KF700_08490 [Hyphomonadaceae bacterium]|nr:hypothetical protein [Hyphomonadaceae bacterium]
MSQPHDPFAQSFDSIEIDNARAPGRDAIERAMATLGTRQNAAETPGFTLVDDAGGRFVVDRESGIVSLAGEYVLTSDAGAVHAARLRVVEASGASYELDMRLKITGMVPRMLGDNDIDFLAEIPAFEPAPAPTPRMVEALPWAGYSPAAGGAAVAAMEAVEGAYGGLLRPAPFRGEADLARLHLFTPLPPAFSAGAAWIY